MQIPAKNQKLNQLVLREFLSDQQDKNPNNIKKTPLNDTALKQSKATKQNWWYLNTALSAAADLFLVNESHKKNDIMGQRFGTQDIITNIGIALENVHNPKVTVNQFMELIKETTCFTIPLTILTPILINQVAKWGNLPNTPDNTHHIDYSVAIGTTLPLLISEALGYFLDKAEPKQKLSKQELELQSYEVKKIYYAAAIAGLIKSGLLLTSITKTPPVNGNKRIANAMTAATLFNTLKAIPMTYLAHKRGEKVRASKTASPVFFDGVVSQVTAYGAEYLHNNTLNIDVNNRWKPHITALESVIFGAFSIGGINLVRNTLDPILDRLVGTPDRLRNKNK